MDQNENRQNDTAAQVQREQTLEDARVGGPIAGGFIGAGLGLRAARARAMGQALNRSLPFAPGVGYFLIATAGGHIFDQVGDRAEACGLAKATAEEMPGERIVVAQAIQSFETPRATAESTELKLEQASSEENPRGFE